MRSPLLSSLLGGLLIACGPGNDESSSRSAEQHAIVDRHPCDVFTTGDVSTRFALPQELVKVERGEVPGNIFCSYEWDLPDRDAIAARNQASLVMAMTGGGGLAALNQEPMESKLFITFHGANFSSSTAALGALDAMVDNLERGVSATTDDVTFEFKTRFEPVSGIGERAVWNEKLRQVSAVHGTLLYHVRLQRHAEAHSDRPDAEAVARAVGAAL